MFSSKHKNTAFFSPLNQFSAVCLRALKAVPDINKAFKNFLTNTLLMFALLLRKVNFTQLEIYGNYCEKTYRSGFSRDFDWVGFNLGLGCRLFGQGDRKAIAIDCIEKKLLQKFFKLEMSVVPRAFWRLIRR